MPNYYTLVLFFLFSLPSLGQIKIGATAGVNMSRFNNKYQATNGSYFNTNSIGIRVGVFSEIPIFHNITFSPKLLYNQLGDRERTDLDFSDGFYTNNIDYALDYLSIPLNFRFFNTVYVEIGPQIGILLNHTFLNENIGDPESDFDFGANMEVGYMINEFRISINAYHSVVNVFEVSSFNRNLMLRNFSLSFGLSYVLY